MDFISYRKWLHKHSLNLSHTLPVSGMHGTLLWGPLIHNLNCSKWMPSPLVTSSNFTLTGVGSTEGLRWIRPTPIEVNAEDVTKGDNIHFELFRLSIDEPHSGVPHIPLMRSVGRTGFYHLSPPMQITSLKIQDPPRLWLKRISS